MIDQRPLGFEEYFRQIQRELSKRDVTSLVLTLSDRLHTIEELEVDQWQGWLPWYLLLLIRWSFEYGGTRYPPKQVNPSVLPKLINLINQAESHHPLLEEGTYSGALGFFRTRAFQQFWLQHRLSGWDIARQYFLFYKYPVSESIQIQFAQIFGMKTNEFLGLSLAWLTLIRLNPRNIVFASSLLQGLDYSEDTIKAFFRALSHSIQETRIFLSERKQSVKNPFFQVAEQTPFIRYPMLRLQNGYLIYSKRVFEQTIQNFIYTALKYSEGSTFSEDFGRVLEKYVHESLLSTKLRFYTEKDLRRNFSLLKVTDFVLPFENCTVMIEVKATEIKPSVQVYPRTEQLISELKDTIIKAVIQGFSTADALSRSNDDLEIQCRSDFYLLIITYRDHYLGSGQEAWKEFLGDAVAAELKQRGLDEQKLDPAKIAILSLREFDELIGLLWAGQADLNHILVEMVKSNSSPKTSKYLFSMHFPELSDEEHKHPFLTQASGELVKEIEEKFQH